MGVLFCGTLEKRHPLTGATYPRFVVLTASALHWFRRPEKSELFGEPRGVLSLSTLRKASIVGPERREVCLEFDTFLERVQSMESIRASSASSARVFGNKRNFVCPTTATAIAWRAAIDLAKKDDDDVSSKTNSSLAEYLTEEVANAMEDGYGDAGFLEALGHLVETDDEYALPPNPPRSPSTSPVLSAEGRRKFRERTELRFAAVVYRGARLVATNLLVNDDFFVGGRASDSDSSSKKNNNNNNKKNNRRSGFFDDDADYLRNRTHCLLDVFDDDDDEDDVFTVVLCDGTFARTRVARLLAAADSTDESQLMYLDVVDPRFQGIHEIKDHVDRVKRRLTVRVGVDAGGPVGVDVGVDAGGGGAGVVTEKKKKTKILLKEEEEEEDRVVVPTRTTPPTTKPSVVVLKTAPLVPLAVASALVALALARSTLGLVFAFLAGAAVAAARPGPSVNVRAAAEYVPLQRRGPLRRRRLRVELVAEASASSSSEDATDEDSADTKKLDFGKFLAAAKGDETEATKRWRQSRAWRRRERVDLVLKEEQPFYDAIKEAYPHWLGGRSRRGELVYWERVGYVDADKLRKAGVTLEALLRHYVFLNEWTWRVLAPAATGHESYQIVVLDVQGVRLHHVGGLRLEYLRACADIAQLNYPDRTSKYVVVNAPSWFAAVWRVVEPMLHPDTRGRIAIYRPGKPSRDGLLDLIEPHHVPECYGGTFGAPHPIDVARHKTPEELACKKFVDALNH